MPSNCLRMVSACACSFRLLKIFSISPVAPQVAT
jgi:hypothetical protein